jgi:HlyD family secretion protein
MTAGWIVLANGIVGLLQGSGATATSPSALASRLTALGRVEPAGDVIDIGAMVGDRLVSVKVKEGDIVKKGEPLAYLDSGELRRLEVEATQQQLKEVEARRDAELTLAEARITAARLSVELAKTHQAEVDAEKLKVPVLQKAYELAVRNAQRLAGLSKEQISDQEHEQSDLAAEKAKAELGAANKLLAKDEQSNRLALAAAQAELAAAEAAKQVALNSIPEKSLRKKLELVEAQRDRSVLCAPCDGTVLKVSTRPGELIGPTPILQMADLTQMVVIAQVYETDLKRVVLGQQATVSSRSFPSPYDNKGLEGTVVRVGHLILRPSVQELNPLAPTDRHAAEVWIELTKPSSELARNFVHMQVDVELAAQP